jgi:hypothetical protein
MDRLLVHLLDPVGLRATDHPITLVFVRELYVWSQSVPLGSIPINGLSSSDSARDRDASALCLRSVYPTRLIFEVVRVIR